MTYQNSSTMFNCPKCGTNGAIFVVKIAGNKIVIKQKCPRHGGRAFKVPLMQKDNVIDNIRDGVFRCTKCGNKATASWMKVSGPWALIRCYCPTHGKMPIQKIWNSVFNEISSKEIKPQSVPSLPTQSQEAQTEAKESESSNSDEKKFCPHCGTPIEARAKFCNLCGSEID